VASPSASYVLTRPQRVFVVCAGIFLAALVLAEAIAGKFFVAFTLPAPITILGQSFPDVVMTTGVLAFPITFIVTDVMNEYFGRRGIRFVTALGVALVFFEFALLQVAIPLPTASFSPVPDEAFRTVFGTTGRVIFGSLTAYLVGQLIDIALFHRLRKLTGGRHLWLRATGSTFGSQLLDTLIVLTVAFAGQLGAGRILAITLFNYSYKLLIAVAITPLIYLAHRLIDRYLGRETAEALAARAAADESGVVVPEAG
jgi:uncharacterized integral membrane protein (TIGR00697 family)